MTQYDQRGRQRRDNRPSQPPKPNLGIRVLNITRSGGEFYIRVEATSARGKNPNITDVQFRVNGVDWGSPVSPEMTGRATTDLCLSAGVWTIEVIQDGTALGKSQPLHLPEPDLEVTASEPSRIGGWRSAVSVNVFIPGERRIPADAEEVELFLDGQSKGSFLTTSAGAITAVDFTNLSLGSHRVEARLKNGQRRGADIHVPYSEPDLQLTEPVKTAAGWSVKANVTVSIPGRDRTTVALEPVQILLDGNAVGVIPTNHAGLATYELSNLKGGDHVIEAIIIESGRNCQRSVSIPKPKLAKPLIKTTLSTGQTTFHFTVVDEDSKPVAGVVIQIIDSTLVSGSTTLAPTDNFGQTTHTAMANPGDDRVIRYVIPGVPVTENNLISVYG